MSSYPVWPGDQGDGAASNMDKYPSSMGYSNPTLTLGMNDGTTLTTNIPTAPAVTSMNYGSGVLTLNLSDESSIPVDLPGSSPFVINPPESVDPTTVFAAFAADESPLIYAIDGAPLGLPKMIALAQTQVNGDLGVDGNINANDDIVSKGALQALDSNDDAVFSASASGVYTANNTLDDGSGVASLKSLSISEECEPAEDNEVDLGYDEVPLGPGGIKRRFKDLHIAGDAYIAGTLTAGSIDAGALSYDSDLLPDTTASYSIGSSTQKWKDGHFSGNISTGDLNASVAIINELSAGAIGGGLTPVATESHDLGASSYKWRDAHLSRTLRMLNIGNDILPTTHNGYYIGSDTQRWVDLYLSRNITMGGGFANPLNPTASGVHNLGTNTLRWYDLWLSRNANIGGALSTGTVASNLIPSTTASYDLGSTSVKWKNAEFSGYVGADHLGSATLYTTGDATVSGSFYSTGPLQRFYGVSEFKNHLRPADLDVVDVGTVANPFRDGHFSGTVNAGSFVPPSDARLKENVTTIDGAHALQVLNELRPVVFNMIGDTRTQSGLIAQEVRDVWPELVHENANGQLGVRYMEIISTLVAAVQKLDTVNQSLQARIEVLEM